MENQLIQTNNFGGDQFVQDSSVGIHRPVFDPLAHHCEAWKGGMAFC
jgi:hypothetical protein